MLFGKFDVRRFVSDLIPTGITNEPRRPVLVYGNLRWPRKPTDAMLGRRLAAQCPLRAQCTGGSVRRVHSPSSGTRSPLQRRRPIRQLLDEAERSAGAAPAEVTVAGWVRSVRAQKRRAFAHIDDGSCAAGLQVRSSSRCCPAPQV